MATSTYKPEECMVDGVCVKVLKNWKIVQVRDGGVCVVEYNKDGDRIWTTTEIETGNGAFVTTKSGSIYLLDPQSKFPSLWELGLQAKRPEEYEKLKDLKVL